MRPSQRAVAVRRELAVIDIQDSGQFVSCMQSGVDLPQQSQTQLNHL